MSEYEDLKTHMLMWSINVTPEVSVFCVYPVKKCTVHSSLLKKPVTGMTYLDMLQM